MKTYTCCDERRRDAVRDQRTLKGVVYTGIDYLEIDFDKARQAYILRIYFIHAPQPGTLKKENVRITGGERIRDVTVAEASLSSKILELTLNKQGDNSTYTLTLSADTQQLQLDRLLSSIDFTFNLLTNTIDCAPEEICGPQAQLTPDIDYLARDFTSFRQLMLDRLTTLMPQWQERSAADMGVMLVEALAYVADHLSYQQDVIATEAYLNTARRRVSARRHARLLDYEVIEGCNARVWVQVQVNKEIAAGAVDENNAPVSLLENAQLLTRIAGQDKVVFPLDSPIYNLAMSAQPTVFESMGNVNGLFPEHNEISFYTWGALECCLPGGSTRATLRGKLSNLKPGDVLIFKELVDPHTGAEEDAEPTHRQAMRLTKVLTGEDPLGNWSPEQDQPYVQADPPKQDTVIAEFEVVEEDRLLIQEARMTDTASGRLIDKQNEWSELDTRATVHRYVIEKADKSIVTVEVRMREEESDVEVHVVEAGHLVKHEEDDRETERQLKIEVEQEASRKASKQPLAEMEEEAEDIMEQTTAKLSTIKMTPQDIAEIDTQELLSAHSPDEKETDKEERARGKETTTTGTRARSHTVHTYQILQKPDDPEPDYHLDITEIEWGYEDALRFPLCISAFTDYEHGHRLMQDVSIALGNIVLADNGRSLPPTDRKLTPDAVPQSSMNWAATQNGQPCAQPQVMQVPPRFYPQLKYAPLTFAAPYDESDTTLSAAAIMQFDTSAAVPAIALQSDMLGDNDKTTPLKWLPQRDLLRRGATDTHFVAEVESDGSAYLRFGDDVHGLRPQPQTRFLATKYRVGNGAAGNIGHDTLYHIASDSIPLQEAITSVNNPLPALGGTDQESIEDIRQNVAGSFLQPQRGVTPQDYKAIIERDFAHLVQRANAILRWTGSWYTVFLAVERVGGMPVDNVFKQQLRQQMEKYRMAGTDLVVVAPVYVPLKIAMTFTVKSGYLPANVETALLQVFSNRQLPDGERGVFYADTENYTFGSTVYLNPLYTAARNMPGVDTATIDIFQRQGIAGTGRADGMLAMEWLEIPILENNPQYPERGHFSLTVKIPEGEVQYV